MSKGATSKFWHTVATGQNSDTQWQQDRANCNEKSLSYDWLLIDIKGLVVQTCDKICSKISPPPFWSSQPEKGLGLT